MYFFSRDDDKYWILWHLNSKGYILKSTIAVLFLKVNIENIIYFATLKLWKPET